MLDPHFSSSFTPKPRPPQPQLRKIPHVFHSSQPPSNTMSLPPCFPNVDYLQTTPVISPQDLPFFFLSAQPHVLHTRSQTGSFPLTPGLAIPAETEAEEGDGTGREATPRAGCGRRAAPGSAPCLAPVEDPLHLGEVLGRDVPLQARLQRLQAVRHGAVRDGTGRGKRKRAGGWARADR